MIPAASARSRMVAASKPRSANWLRAASSTSPRRCRRRLGGFFHPARPGVVHGEGGPGGVPAGRGGRGQAIEDQRGDALRDGARPRRGLPPPRQARLQRGPVQHMAQDPQIHPFLDRVHRGGRADQGAPEPVQAGRLGMHHGLEAGAGRGRRVEHGDLQGRLMPERDRGDLQGKRPQGRQRVRGDGSELPHDADEVSVVVLDQLDRDGFLGLEVVVEAAGQDPGRRRDLAHRGVRVPVGGEQASRRVQDLGAPARPGGQGRLGHGRCGRGHHAIIRLNRCPPGQPAPIRAVTSPTGSSPHAAHHRRCRAAPPAPAAALRGRRHSAVE